MGSHPKIFLFAVIALCLFAFSPIYADDSPIFSWRKVLSEPAVGIDWSPDGNSIVFGDPDSSQVGLLNWQTGEVIWRTPFSNPNTISAYAFSARWSPDGRWIAVTSEGKLYLLDPQTGHFHAIRPSVPPKRDQPDYVLARWGSDSTALASLDSHGFIDILAVPSGKIIQTIDLGTPYSDVYSNAFDWSPDGQFFAAPIWIEPMMNPVIGFWDRSGNLLKSYTHESDTDPAPSTPCLAIYADGLPSYPYVEWAKDSRTLVAAGTFGYGICRLNSDGTVFDHPIDDNGSSIFRWSPDQRWLVGAANAGTALWFTDAANNYQTVVRQFVTVPNSFAWSPDSQHLAIGAFDALWIGTLITSS